MWSLELWYLILSFLSPNAIFLNNTIRRVCRKTKILVEDPSDSLWKNVFGEPWSRSLLSRWEFRHAHFLDRVTRFSLTAENVDFSSVKKSVLQEHHQGRYTSLIDLRLVTVTHPDAFPDHYCSVLWSDRQSWALFSLFHLWRFCYLGFMLPEVFDRGGDFRATLSSETSDSKTWIKFQYAGASVRVDFRVTSFSSLWGDCLCLQVFDQHDVLRWTFFTDSKHLDLPSCASHEFPVKPLNVTIRHTEPFISTFTLFDFYEGPSTRSKTQVCSFSEKSREWCYHRRICPPSETGTCPEHLAFDAHSLHRHFMSEGSYIQEIFLLTPAVSQVSPLTLLFLSVPQFVHDGSDRGRRYRVMLLRDTNSPSSLFSFDFTVHQDLSQVQKKLHLIPLWLNPHLLSVAITLDRHLFKTFRIDLRP